eukprot:6492070-Amphidinium_carterae.3
MNVHEKSQQFRSHKSKPVKTHFVLVSECQILESKRLYVAPQGVTSVTSNGPTAGQEEDTQLWNKGLCALYLHADVMKLEIARGTCGKGRMNLLGSNPPRLSANASASSSRDAASLPTCALRTATFQCPAFLDACGMSLPRLWM